MLRYQEHLGTSGMGAGQGILRKRVHCNDKLATADQNIEDAHGARPLASRDHGWSTAQCPLDLNRRGAA